MKTLTAALSLAAVLGVLIPPDQPAWAVPTNKTCAVDSGGNCMNTDWNFNVPFPTGKAADNFEVVLPGDQVGIATGTYNSFPNGGAPIETYDPASNTTTLEWTGVNGSQIPTAANDPQGTTYGPGHSAQPHFGFSGIVPGATSGGETVPPVLMYWTFGATVVNTIPSVGMIFNSGTTGTLGYVIYHVSVNAPGDTNPANATTNWFEFPYDGTFSASIDASAGGVTLSQVGYMLSSTQIPLDNLNANTDGTGLPFSDFSTLGIADGTTLANGQTVICVQTPGTAVQACSLPEPGGMLVLLSGVTALMLRRRPRAA